MEKKSKASRDFLFTTLRLARRFMLDKEEHDMKQADRLYGISKRSHEGKSLDKECDMRLESFRKEMKKEIKEIHHVNERMTHTANTLTAKLTTPTPPPTGVEGNPLRGVGNPHTRKGNNCSGAEGWIAMVPLLRMMMVDCYDTTSSSQLFLETVAGAIRSTSWQHMYISLHGLFEFSTTLRRHRRLTINHYPVFGKHVEEDLTDKLSPDSFLPWSFGAGG